MWEILPAPSKRTLDAAAYEARGKGSLGEVYMAWRQNEQSLYDRTLSYLARFQRNADAAMIARHNPSGPGCAQPNVDVEAPNPITLEFPEEAKASTMHDVTVLAKVAVDATGKIESIWTLQSSGNMYIDRSTLVAARQTTYLPKIAKCKPVPGTYVFRATFDPLH